MKNYEKELMSKNGQAVVRLGKEFLNFQEGQRLQTVEKYAEKYEMARGTIQLALRYLTESGAVSLQSRGHLGTYITGLDYQKLWDISGLGSILGLMPLPYTKRYEGMATGLYETFRQADLPFNLAYMRGASYRLQMVEKGIYHFAVVSKLAVRHVETTGKRFKIIHEFSEESYVTKHGVILRQGLKELKSGIKVALDESSPDQSLLTKKECQALQVEYVPTAYNQILARIETGEVDAAVWNLDELQEKSISGHIISLKNEEARELDRDGTKAVLAIDFSNGYIGEIMARLVNFLKIEQIQSKVVKNKKIPMY